MQASKPVLETSAYNRNLVMLLLDRSGSMASEHVEVVGATHVNTTRMQALSDAVVHFLMDEKTGLRSTRIGPSAEVAIGGFNGSKLHWVKLGSRQGGPFTLLRHITTKPTIEVAENELTPLAAAIKDGVAAMRARIAQIQAHPTLSLRYRPTIFLLTDGQPEPENQDIAGATALLAQSAFSDKRRPEFYFYAIGINDADDARMRQIFPSAYYPLRGVSLSEIMRIVTLTADDAAGYAATQKAMERRMRGARKVGDA